MRVGEGPAQGSSLAQAAAPLSPPRALRQGWQAGNTVTLGVMTPPWRSLQGLWEQRGGCSPQSQWALGTK